MAYEIRPMPFNPSGIKGLSEKILVSHYENNYSGAVKRSTQSAHNSPSSTSPRHPFTWSTGSSAKS